MMMTSAAAAEAKPAGTRRRKLVRVNQHYIDCILKQREARPRRLFPSRSFELASQLYADQPEKRERALGLRAQIAAIVKMTHDKEDGIIEQYRSQGYAMEEIEISDSEAEDDAADVED